MHDQKEMFRKSQFSPSFYILSCCFPISPWRIVYTHDLLNVRLSINFKSILGPEKPRNHYSFKIYRKDHLKWFFFFYQQRCTCGIWAVIYRHIFKTQINTGFGMAHKNKQNYRFKTTKHHLLIYSSI